MAHEIALAALVRDGQILLAHRHPQRRWYPDCWDLIGGHVEPGESPEEAVRRECREEIAVEVSEERRVDLDVSDPDLVPHAFLITSWIGRPVNAAPEEHDALAWFRIDDLAGLPLAHPSYATWLPVLASLAGGPLWLESPVPKTGSFGIEEPSGGEHPDGGSITSTMSRPARRMELR